MYSSSVKSISLAISISEALGKLIWKWRPQLGLVPPCAPMKSKILGKISMKSGSFMGGDFISMPPSSAILLSNSNAQRPSVFVWSISP